MGLRPIKGDEDAIGAAGIPVSCSPRLEGANFRPGPDPAAQGGIGIQAGRAPAAAPLINSYSMAIVASLREDAPPMVTTSGTALPVGAFAGRSTFT